MVKLTEFVPDLIGRIVEVEMVKRPQLVLNENHLLTYKYVGVLESYTRSPVGVAFTLEGDTECFIYANWEFTVADAGDTASNRILAQMLNPLTGSGVLAWVNS